MKFWIALEFPIYVWVIIFVAMLACGVWGHRIAGLKGQPPLIGFFIGLLLNLVGVFILNSMKAVENMPPRKLPRRSTGTLCPNCSSKVAPLQEKCHNCGAVLPVKYRTSS